MAGIWHFAAGMIVINLLALLFTQLDKILLARMLTLDAFWLLRLGRHGGRRALHGDRTDRYCVYPRFTELATRGDEIALRAVFHQAAQMVTVFVGAIALVLVLFAESTLRVWTGIQSWRGPSHLL